MKRGPKRIKPYGPYRKLGEVIEWGLDVRSLVAHRVSLDLGFNQSYIGVICKGHRCPSIPALQRIAKVLGTTAGDLLKRADL